RGRAPERLAGSFRGPPGAPDLRPARLPNRRRRSRTGLRSAARLLPRRGRRRRRRISALRELPERSLSRLEGLARREHVSRSRSRVAMSSASPRRPFASVVEVLPGLALAVAVMFLAGTLARWLGAVVLRLQGLDPVG